MKRTSTKVKFIVAGAGIAAAAATGMALTASPSGATAYSPVVHLQGSTGCQQTLYFPHSITVALTSGDNETATAPFYLYNYEMTFNNIPQIPDAATGTATITCTSLLGTAPYTFTRPVTVRRSLNTNAWTATFTAG